jgi:hypothetical protein
LESLLISNWNDLISANFSLISVFMEGGMAGGMSPIPPSLSVAEISGGMDPYHLHPNSTSPIPPSRPESEKAGGIDSYYLHPNSTSPITPSCPVGKAGMDSYHIHPNSTSPIPPSLRVRKAEKSRRNGFLSSSSFYQPLPSSSYYLTFMLPFLCI